MLSSITSLTRLIYTEFAFDVEYIYGFVWWGVCKQSRWRHSVTEPSEDSGYVLLWQRYDNNKMVAMRYYSTSSTVQFFFPGRFGWLSSDKVDLGHRSGSIPGRYKRFFSSSEWFWVPLSFLWNGHRGLFPREESSRGLKLILLHLPPSQRFACSYATIPP